VPLSPEGARVRVFNAPLETADQQSRMPAACRLVSATAPVSMTELEMEGQRDPYRVQRNTAGAAGADVLLVRSRVVTSRHDPDCPAAARITDCPPSSGAWFRVVFESYACGPDAHLPSSRPEDAPREPSAR